MQHLTAFIYNLPEIRHHDQVSTANMSGDGVPTSFADMSYEEVSSQKPYFTSCKHITAYT